MSVQAGEHWRVGTCIDNRFTITGCLSHTGAAVVWQGNDISLSATVTIVQHPRVQHAAMQDSRRQEAQAASSLVSEIWIPVLGFGEWVGRSYLVAEEVKGDSLEGVLRSAQARGEGLPQRLICSVALEVLTALESSEATGFVHGDLCTGCVFMCEGNVRVLSIGMASHASRQTTNEALPHASPEQLREEPMDVTSDLWGLGVMMYRMASGKYPFVPAGHWTMRDAILMQPLPDLMEHAMSNISSSLVLVISRALERNRDLRYRGVSDMRKDLLLAMQDSRQNLTQTPPHPEQERQSTAMMTPRTERQALTPSVSAVPMLTPRGSVMQTPRGSTVFQAVGDAVLPKSLGLSQLSRAGFSLHPLEREPRYHPSPSHPAPQPAQPHTPRSVPPPHLENEPGTVGLIVTRDPPHRVIEVADMCDANGTMQGQPGYSNPLVLPGDRLVAIDGRECEHIDIAQVHSMLKGPAGSLLALDFRRNNPGRGSGVPPVHTIHVTIARHAPRNRTPHAVQRAAPPPVEQQEVRHVPTTPRGTALASSIPARRGPLEPTFHDPQARGREERSPGTAGREGAGLSQGGLQARPKVVRVGPHEGGPDQARDIGSALQMVADGGSVLVAGGVYEEELRVTRPVYIKAEDGENVEVRGGQGRPLLVCASDGVFVSGVKLEQLGGDAARRGRHAVRCIEVAQGHLTLSECTVRSEKGIGLMVTESAAAVVKRSMLHSSGKCGMLAMDGGEARVEHTAIQDNRMYGVVSQSGGKVVLSECNVERNNAVGVLVHRSGADCSIVGSAVLENGEMGIAVQDGAQARAETSRVGRNKHAGLYADGPSAWVSAFKCEFTENGVRGVGVQGGACVEAVECKVTHNAHEGVFVSGSNSRSMLQGNEIANNGSKGVGVQSTGFVLLKGCSVTGNKEGGVFACDPNTLATIKDNTISHNGMRGIGVQLGATAEVEGNLLSDNAAEGVYVSRKGSRALVVKNQITNNGVKGIGVQYGADASIESNEIVGNKLAGVHVDGQGSRATLRFNNMRGNPAAVVTEDGAVTRMVNNQLQDADPARGASHHTNLSDLSSPREPPRPSPAAQHTSTSASTTTSWVPSAMPAPVESQRMVTPRQADVAFKNMLTPRDTPTPRGQILTPRQALPTTPRPGPNNLVRTANPGGQPWSASSPGGRLNAEGGGGVGAPRVKQNMRGRLQAFEGGDAAKEQSPPNRPAAVPSLKIGGDFQGIHGGLNGGHTLQTPRGRAPLRPEEEGDPSVKDWLMMPTYLNTPRTTRSTLDGDDSGEGDRQALREDYGRSRNKVNREGIGGWALGDIGEWGEHVAALWTPRGGNGTPR